MSRNTVGFRRRNRSGAGWVLGLRYQRGDRHRLRPGLFELEERRLLATFTVTSTADDGSAGTLRSVIAAANATLGANTIDFDPTVFSTPQTITLSGISLELSNTSGTETITGPAVGVTVSAGGRSRVFQVDGGVTASISGLILTGGDVGGDGGGLLNEGTVNLTDCTLNGNSVGYFNSGGGLANDGGTATLTDCTVSSNSDGKGGGVWNSNGTTTLTDCKVNGNTAHYGGGLANSRGTMTLTGCTVSNNLAGGFDGGDGGGLSNYVGVMTLTDCTVTGNRVVYNTGSGGGLISSGTATLTSCTISNNSAESDSGGVANGGTMKLTGCTISGNSANSSGGLGNGTNQTATLTDCTISGNHASSNGGGLMNHGKANLSDCTLSDNSATNGGGADNSGYFGETSLTSCTITGNSAVTGGGLDANGGLYNAFTVNLTACTVSANSSPNQGAGLANHGPTTLTDTIVAGNTLTNSLIASDISGTQSVSGSYNLLGTGGQGGLTNGVNGNIFLPTLSDLGLAPLGSYGGPTQTMALLPGSWAIGNGTAVSGVTTDQRGEPLDLPPDIGAFQLQKGLVIHSQPSSTATAGQPFATQPVIYEEDEFGNLETGDNTTVVTASLGSGAGPLQGTITATVTGGVATFTNLADDTAETITLRFASGSLATATSSSIVVSSAAASQLVVTQQPSATATAGQPFATQPVVKEEDPFGNVMTSDSTSTVTAARGDVGTASLQGSDLTVTVVNGVATFSGLSYDKAETMDISFSTNASGVSSATSHTIAVSPAAASRLVIAQQPSATATAGEAFPTQPVIYEEDQYDNAETGDNSTVVTAALSSGRGPLQGTTSVTVNGGVASFTSLADNTAETIALSFSGNGLMVGPSTIIVISPASASELVIHTQPSSTATAGQPFPSQPVIYEEDLYGNLVTGDNTTGVTAALNTGTGPLEGTATVTVNGGVATFTNLGDNTAEKITLGFSSEKLTSATSTSIDISATSATQLVLLQQPSATATAGSAFATQPVVVEEDKYNNVVTTDSTSRVTAARGNAGTASLQGSSLTVTLADGVATFSGLSYDKAESMDISFTTNASGVSSITSNDVAVRPATASQLVISQQPPSTATAGQAFATQPVVYEEDPYNNLETGDNTTVVTAMLSTGAGPLEGTTTATVSGGVARFSNLADKKAETAKLDFTSGTMTSSPSNKIVVSSGPASGLVIAVQPSSTATAGQTFAVQPVVDIVDSNGNIETTDNSSVVTVSLASGTGPLQGTTLSVTVVNGVATFSGLGDNTAETITLKFSEDGTTVGPSNSIVVRPATPFRLKIQTQPSATATAGQAFATQPMIEELDQYGNLETTDSSTVITAALSFGNGPLLGTPTATMVGGVATFTDLADSTSGLISLGFSTGVLSVGVLFVGPSNQIVIDPGVATQLVIQTQPYSSVTAGSALTDPIVIDEEDKYNNTVTTDNSTVVTASLASGGGTLYGTLTAKLVNGVASFGDLEDDTAGTLVLQFAVPSLPSVTANPSVVKSSPATKIVTQPSGDIVSGKPFAVDVDAYDAYGNLATSFILHAAMSETSSNS